MKFCSSCGSSVIQKIPQGDNRLRYVCESCDEIHYQNPRVIAGILPIYEDKILLCRRSIEPRVGYWTLPAGFLENGESTLEGAMRECVEESLANVVNPELYAIFDIPQIHQVYIFYRADLQTPVFGPTGVPAASKAACSVASGLESREIFQAVALNPVETPP